MANCHLVCKSLIALECYQNQSCLSFLLILAFRYFDVLGIPEKSIQLYFEVENARIVLLFVNYVQNYVSLTMIIDAMHSASTVESAIIFCTLVDHVIGPMQNVMIYPTVDQRLSASPAQSLSLSQKAIS
ncbi:hypothetical protein T4D_10927 [Trichinella pseudospiralis]|nr:hypothetical protein T4D_6614 [Trichinella pseudospiralis]KRY81277.1 hypothetical protein T4D_798 [Trichinella pseudospiralis]KRY82097.1 hypothetical protein T4D_10927 [Trichinella pseudospiralis]